MWSIRVLLGLALALALLPPPEMALAQGLPNTPECQRYLAYARGAGAMGTLGPLYQHYNACLNSGRSGTRPSNIPPGSTHCGGNTYCKPGLRCASGGKCIEKDVVDCGNGKFCTPESKCAKQGGCLPKDAADCGSYYCTGGNVCAANKKCVSQSHAQRVRGGGPLDSSTAEKVRPLAAMAQDSQSSSNTASRYGYRRAGRWEDILKKGGKSPSDIAEWRKAGFGASVFTKSEAGSRRVVVAFVGPEPKGLSGAALRDWIKANWSGQDRPKPYELALEFARIVQQQTGKSDQLTVTGFSLGAALATFVGGLLKLETVTFDAPSSRLAPVPILGEEQSPNQTNIVTAGDPVSDPLADPDFSASGSEIKPLPGQTYIIEAPDAKENVRDVKGVFGSIDQLARAK